MLINMFKNIHGNQRWFPWMTLSMITVMIVLYCIGGSVFDVFVFDKAAILKGEIWRMVTGHFVHYNISHLFWDMLAFLIIGFVIEKNNPQHFIPSFFISCGVVSVWLFFCEQGVTTYCGLSGALNGLLVLAVVMQWKRTQETMYLYVLLLTLGKIFFEMTQHQTVFANVSVQALPTSHAAGFWAGLVYLLIIKIRKNIFVENIK